MLLDLSEIVIRDGMKSAVDIDQESVPDPDLRFAEPVTGHIEFQNSGDLLNINGQVRTVVEIPCARCLADVRVPLNVILEERLPLEEVTHPKPPSDEDSGLETIVSSIIHLDQGRPILDVDELIRQQLVAEIPIRTLCGGDCRGLCPKCGTDLNQGPCACPAETTDSPFAALSVLLEQDGEERNGGSG
jgi:uncharacterized protein